MTEIAFILSLLGAAIVIALVSALCVYVEGFKPRVKHRHAWDVTGDRASGSEVMYLTRRCACGRVEQKAICALGTIWDWQEVKQ